MVLLLHFLPPSGASPPVRCQRSCLSHVSFVIAEVLDLKLVAFLSDDDYEINDMLSLEEDLVTVVPFDTHSVFFHVPRLCWLAHCLCHVDPPLRLLLEFCSLGPLIAASRSVIMTYRQMGQPWRTFLRVVHVCRQLTECQPCYTFLLKYRYLITQMSSCHPCCNFLRVVHVCRQLTECQPCCTFLFNYRILIT